MNKKDLEKHGIFDWKDIENEYKHPDLLLGNGFTLQFSSHFSYSSLFEKFLEKCDPTYQTLFRQFNTTNFELIQKQLTYALSVNNILRYQTSKIEGAIQQLKDGLIKTIEEIHPRSEEIDFCQLENIARQLESFGDIYTTNYDLYLYHIVMKSNDIKSHNPNVEYLAYQDYFWGDSNKKGFKEFVARQGHPFKHIFYLHGALFIFKNGMFPLKLVRDYKTELIEAIAAEIRSGNFPLFISEGFGDNKLDRIYRNNYLYFCYEKLRYSRNSIIILGNSLGEFDSHILNVLKNGCRSIVYCIYCGARKSKNEILLAKGNFLQKFEGYSGDIRFVDSTTLFDL